MQIVESCVESFLLDFFLLVSSADTLIIIFLYTFWDSIFIDQFPCSVSSFQLETLIANNGKDVEIQVSYVASYLNISY
jgi:hypothetical protein